MEALERPSIPNIHIPAVASSSTPKTTTTTAAPKPRQRESKWTGAQLANLASALEAAFFHTAAADAFAGENGKTAKQVRETFSFLVNKRIFEFSDEAVEGNEGRGRGRGKGKVARRFEREMRADRYVCVCVFLSID